MGLIANDGLCQRIHNPWLTRGDQLQIIIPFAQHFYSSNPGFTAVIQQMSLSEISMLVHTPGDIKQDLERQGWAARFDPPRWYLLPTPADSATGPPVAGQLMTTAQLEPLLHMGISPLDFCALSPLTQKTTALATLPVYLTDKLPLSNIIQALITLGSTTPDEIIPLLQTVSFHASLVALPLESEAPQIIFHYHLVLNNDGQGQMSAWQGRVKDILSSWLQAILPLLHRHGHTLTLLSPHELLQKNLPVKHPSLPHDTLS